MDCELYRRYTEKRSSVADLGKVMPYGWANLPAPLAGSWMIYSLMLDDFSRELSNAINAFANNVRKLKIWDALFAELTEHERLEALYEFVDPISTLCLLTPYVIRSRFLYATSHLCHQVNLVREEAWNESSLPADEGIYMDSADKQGTPWQEYKQLKRCMESVGGRALQRATTDFRNAFTHRFSPRIESGIANFATRMLDARTGKVAYSLGGTRPLALHDVVTLLDAELEKCYDCYVAFQNLIAAHVAFISPHNETALAAMRVSD